MMYSGNYNYDNYMSYDKVSNSLVNIRLGFLRKVYGIVSIQLLFTTLVAALFLKVQPVRMMLADSTIGFFILIGAAVVSLCLIGGLSAFGRQYPLNYILLGAFTLCEALLVGSFVTYYTVDSVLMAFGVTCATTIALTIYSMNTTRDVSSWGASLLSVLTIMILLGFINLFLQNPLMTVCLNGAGAILFSLYIIYDIQMIMKKVSPEEYILASAMLYLDVINLFIKILKLLGEKDKKK